MQVYSNPDRGSDPHALPDIEVFYIDTIDAMYHGDGEEAMHVGWYWQSCFPGCHPDGDPVGPFATREEALADAQDLGE